MIGPQASITSNGEALLPITQLASASPAAAGPAQQARPNARLKPSQPARGRDDNRADFGRLDMKGLPAKTVLFVVAAAPTEVHSRRAAATRQAGCKASAVQAGSLPLDCEQMI